MALVRIWTPRRRRLLYALAAVVLLDQLLLWTFVTRPVNSIRTLIDLTGAAEPPYFQLPAGRDTSYASWRRGDVTSIHINTLGFRGQERAASLTAGVRRVIVTGDSITFGIGVNDGEAFPEQLQRQLVEQGMPNASDAPDARDIEVWNAGVPGYAMADHLGLLRRRLLPLHPDLILLQLSRNDSAVPMPLSPTFMGLLGVSGLARAYMIVRFNFVEDTSLFSASFRAYLDECRSAGVRLMVLFEGLPRENEAEVRELTSQRAIPLIGIGGDAYPKLPDDPHYSVEGNRRVAARLLPEVLAALRSGP
jgi:hypothetical protein